MKGLEKSNKILLREERTGGGRDLERWRSLIRAINFDN